MLTGVGTSKEVGESTGKEKEEKEEEEEQEEEEEERKESGSREEEKERSVAGGIRVFDADLDLRVGHGPSAGKTREPISHGTPGGPGGGSRGAKGGKVLVVKGLPHSVVAALESLQKGGGAHGGQN